MSCPNTLSRSPTRKGFTLLELSIVLVIIGLLIGGIFVGQSLIHTAQINAVISEFNRYQTATQNFKMQYQALLGDMNNATGFWGSAGGTGSDATCQNTASTTAATCNGNGNGVIQMSVVAWDETSRFWQHLANAKMIEGSYTGVGSAALPGVSMPASRFGNNSGWSIDPSSVWSGGSGAAFNTDYGTGHILKFCCGTVIQPKDAWAIDKKLDDGKPGMGNVIVYNWPVCTIEPDLVTATPANTYLAAVYKLTVTTASCELWFVASF